MKHVRMLLSLLLLLSLAVPTALGEAVPEPTSGAITQWLDGAVSSVENWAQRSGELEIQGRAIRTVVPDTATIRIGVRKEAETEKEAQAEANRVINGTIEAMKALGIEEGRMKTGRYSITRKYGRSSIGAASSWSRPTGYEASISLTVTVTDFDLINQALDIATDQGANDIGGVQFSLSNEAEIYQLALQDAIRAARAKADAMAEAAGVALIALISLRENGGYSPVYFAAEADTASTYGSMGEAAQVQTQIMPGEMEVSANVTMIYAVK